MENKQAILIAGARGNIGGGADDVGKTRCRIVLLGHSCDKLKAREYPICTLLEEQK